KADATTAADPSSGVVTSEREAAAPQPSHASQDANGASRQEPAPSTTPPAAPPPAAVPRWPAPDPAGAPRAIVAAVIAGVVGAAALTWPRPGVGWLLTGLCAFAGVLIAVWGNRRPEPAAVRAERVAWGLAAVVLLATGTVLAATLAVAGGRTAGGLALSVLVWPGAVVLSWVWVGRARARLTTGNAKSTIRIIAAVAVTAFLVLVFGALLAGA